MYCHIVFSTNNTGSLKDVDNSISVHKNEQSLSLGWNFTVLYTHKALLLYQKVPLFWF